MDDVAILQQQCKRLKEQVHKLKKKWKKQRNETAFFQLEKQRYKSLYQSALSKQADSAKWEEMKKRIAECGRELKQLKHKHNDNSNE